MAGTILITGSNRGLGLALTRRFAAENWQVLACCRDPEGAEELQAESDKHPGIRIFRLDVTDRDRLDELSAELSGEKIDILFNNAGITGPKSQEFGPIDREGWEQAFRVNVVAPYDVTRAFADQVTVSEKKIVAIMGTMLGSIADNGSGGKYVYRSTKAAVHMMGKNLSIDLRDRGITTILLHPGWVRTDMGGEQATLSPEESAQGLYRVVTRLKPEDNGTLLSYDGSPIPW